jgi:peptidoglycan/xylan/chitin deacetylase (PgdA/CDA1 family)
VRLDRIATLYVAQPLGLGGSRVRQLPILMYHSVSDAQESGMAAYYRTVTRPDIFRTQMAALRLTGWRGVTLKEGLESISKPCEVDAKLFAITFDDGFEDFYANAFPALRENSFSATMYLPTAYIAEANKTFKQHRCMTWSQVSELHSAGVEFGSHTVNHPTLWNLDWPEIVTELCDSKRAIEDHLGVAAPSFAYPYAFPQQDREFTKRFRDELQKAGYENCVTTAIGRVTATDDRYTLKRLPANSCDDSNLLEAKLEGAYDWLAWAQSAVKTVKTALRR